MHQSRCGAEWFELTVQDLETLERVRVFRLLPQNIEHRVHKLGSLGVITLGPVVTCPRLAVDKGIGPEEVSKRAGTDEIDDTGLEVDLNGSRDVFFVGCFGKVDID